MKNQIIETFGSITKIEMLINIEHNIIPNTLVLETLEPFPGYYSSNLPANLTPHSIFLLTKDDYDIEELLRISQRTKKFMQANCDYTAAEIHIQNTYHTAIRIKNLDCFERIPEIQQQLLNEEVNFKKDKNIKAPGMIKIHKPFLLEENEEGIYKDKEWDEVGYIEIPYKLKWNRFEKITNRVKNNISNRNFDAALALIYRKDGIRDLIRIYDHKINLERFRELRDKYLDTIKHFCHDIPV